MQAWKAFGKFIGSHLAFIAPICVALGVLFPSQLAFLKPWVTPLFAFMTFQGAWATTSPTWGASSRTRRPCW